MGKVIRVIRLLPDGASETGMGPWKIVGHKNVVSTAAKDRAVKMFNSELIDPSRVRVGTRELCGIRFDRRSKITP